VIHPEDLDAMRDRGLLLARLARFRPALEALREYLRRRPAAPDRDEVLGHMAAIRDRLASLN
jgi:regulator of sirC expression with transglutaminase-like and TPR domain